MDCLIGDDIFDLTESVPDMGAQPYSDTPKSEDGPDAAADDGHGWPQTYW